MHTIHYSLIIYSLRHLDAKIKGLENQDKYMLVSVFHHGKHGLSIILHLILTDISYLNFFNLFDIFFSDYLYFRKVNRDYERRFYFFSGFLMKQSCEQGRIQGGQGDIRPPLTDSGRGVSPPPEFGIFCSYFQNSFSIACLRERNPSAKHEKYLS